MDYSEKPAADPELTLEELNDSTGIPVPDDTSFGTYGLSMPTIVSEPRLKIETLHASELTKVTLLYVVSAVYMVISTIVYLVLANTIWVRPEQIGGETYWIVEPAFWYRVFEFVVEIMVAVALTFMTVYYSVVVLATPKALRTREMAYVFILGISCSVIYIPFFNTVFLPVLVLNDQSWKAVLRISTLLSSCLGITGIFFQIWSTAISFRTPRGQWFPWTYWPKMFILGMFMVTRIAVSFLLNVNLNWLPLSSLATGMEIIFSKDGFSPGLLFMLVANFCTELMVVLYITCEMTVTARYIRSLDYLDYRSLQIGFRQFRYYLALTFVLTTVFGTLNIMLSSNDTMILVAKYQGVYQFRPPSGRLSYLTIIPAYALQQLFFMLPASAPTLTDLIRCRYKKSHNPTESLFRYRVFERHHDPKFKKTSFVMETCIMLFNLAWLPYSYGKDHKEARSPRDFGDNNNKVVSYISDQPTDTHALVLAAEDRIVVAFRGTSSSRNVGTDLRTGRVPVEHMWDDQPAAEMDGTRCWSSPTRPLVHAGFMRVYKTVRRRILEELERLYSLEPRPIFFTGHSLGGALATLSSYDTAKTMNPGEGVFVYTYGSPRAGNHQFVKEYDAVVPCTWRMVNAHDPVTMMPPAFLFHHVGQVALVTADGDLFIDPTMFEMTWMHSSFMSVGLRRHSNSGYAKALTAFVERRHGTRMGYRGVIWKAKITNSGTGSNGPFTIRTGGGIPTDALARRGPEDDRYKMCRFGASSAAYPVSSSETRVSDVRTTSNRETNPLGIASLSSD